MVQGEAVSSFTRMFLHMWYLDEKEKDFDRFLHVSAAPQPSNGFVMPYGDCPLDRDKVGEQVYMDMLNRAQSYIYIMTPYLILDGELENALKYAAERGVDVRIILPGIPDKYIPFALALTHYKSLLESGVKIYEYTPGFVHAKDLVQEYIRIFKNDIQNCDPYLYDQFLKRGRKEKIAECVFLPFAPLM